MFTFSHRSAIASLLAAVVFGCFTVPAARAATPQQVDEAIKKAQRFLLDRCKKMSWEETPAPEKDGNMSHGDQWSGMTALATYALLASGENPQGEQMRSAVKLLEGSPAIGFYAIGVRAQVWGFLQQKPEIKAAMQRDGKLIYTGMRTVGEARGLYWYTPGKDDGYDHSVSQYGVLGMWACSQLGFETPNSFWVASDAAWRKHQNKNGGWGYRASDPTTVSMTAAGVATLFITQDYLHGADFAAGHGKVFDPQIEAGLKYMGDHFPEVFGGGFRFYQIYGVERIGVAAGRKYLGSHNWFEEGANWLVQNQKPDGSWGDGPSEMGGQGGNNISTTSFGILFLVRGRAPVVMNKLQYDITPPKGNAIPGLWNQRPRDVANLCRWMGKEIERDLNWQSVSIDAPVEELLDAPILYIAGSQALGFTTAQVDKLREYVNRGGIILGNADSGNAVFDKSFTKLGKELFPDYEFDDLPPTHVIYTNEQFSSNKWKTKPVVHRLTNHVRELMLLIPQADLSKYWQGQAHLGHEEMHELASDIYLYSVDKQGLAFKGETYLVNPDPKIKAEKTIKVARLKYPGNWNPEPGGWPRLAAVLHNQSKIDLAVDAVEAGTGKLVGYQIAHLTGTAAWAMTPAVLDELRSFIKGGGTLIIDAAGGNTEFDASMESNVAAMFPDAASARAVIPAGHALYKAFDGQPTPIGWRRYARKLLGTLNASRLRGVPVGDRFGIYYSAEDLTVGLVGQPVDGVSGYDPKTATELMADMILFSTNNAWKAPPATAPATPTAPK